MRNLLYICVLLAAIFWAGACRPAIVGDQDGVIARVGDSKLLVSDVASLFNSGISAQDSLVMLESYVDMWVKQELKIQEAEKVFSGDNAEMEKMVRDYRNSLLNYRLDQYHVESRMDTLFDQSAIADYYASHRSDFILDRAIVKGVIVRLPENFRQKAQLKELMSGSGERYQDFVDISVKNDFTLSEFNEWTDFVDFTAFLPSGKGYKYDELLSKQGVTEYRDGSDVYFVAVNQRLAEGDQAPLERISDVIERVLFNQRRQEIIRSYEDSLLNAAISSSRVEIMIHD